MRAELTFTKNTFYIGRNGTGIMKGIAMYDNGQNEVYLTPINSKGKEANCAIKIPFADIPALIAELKLITEPE